MTISPADDTGKNSKYYKAIFVFLLTAIIFAIPVGTILDVNLAAFDFFGYF